MIEAGLAAHFNSDAGLLAIIKEGTFVRAFPMVIPQKIGNKVQVPCLVYAVTGENRLKTYCGTAKVLESMVAVDCYAASMMEARRLNVALRRAILDFRGLMGNVKVRDVTLVNSIVLHEMEPGLFRVADSYSIWHEQE